MGQVYERLDHPFVPHLFDAVKQQCQNNRNGEPDDQIQEAKPQCIPDNEDRLIGTEQHLKVSPSDPGAMEDAIEEIIVLEGNDQPTYWQISKNQIIYNYWSEHDVKRDVLSE